MKAFRDTWQLGIHSYLVYLRDRLVTARELLAESGSIFVQIGDENVHLVRSILDEVFGSENFCTLITLWKTSSATTTLLPTVSDYILWYGKSINNIKYRQLYASKEVGEDAGAEYKSVEFPDGTRRSMSQSEISNSRLLPDGARAFRPSPMTSQSASSTTSVPFDFEGEKFSPGSGGWKTNAQGFSHLALAGRIMRRDKSLSYVRYIDDFPVVPVSNLWLDTRWGFDASERVYVVQTNVRAIQRCMLMTTDPGDLVLDPTCGSGTTAYVAEQWGRRWITIDISRVSIALARTRLMAGRYPYYLLADSPEGHKKEAELNPVSALSGAFSSEVEGQVGNDIKRGFVYERVPHVTLKSIANNEEIDEIHARYQEQLEPLRVEINKLTKKKWEEWEVPRDTSVLPKTVVSGAFVSEVEGQLQKYWELRRARQKEIDASIARRADTEFLYDKPYQDNKRVRVSGPFTVESLSPHRVLTTDDPSTSFREDELNTKDFTQMILENLKTSGVQNTIKNQRLKFERLEPFAGTWIQAIGEYTEKDGATRRAAISIGPELGTVSPAQVKEAAKEAVHGVGFDMLIVCGFAFDPHVSEEAKRYGSLTVLPTRMNPDLAMGDELLKKTGAGNLFMVFGEPDLDIKRENGKVTVQLKGLDVYDPTTGEIRSNSTDDIACWFIDTDYNEETFIVRHAYFTGADNPYDKLKRALKAEIDEAAWSALYSTQSYPFEKPSSGKIAVKVINHYGDEVLKVYEVK